MTRDQDIEVCGNCGYCLRGLPPAVARCPECGHDFSILGSVGVDVRDFRIWSSPVAIHIGSYVLGLLSVGLARFDKAAYWLLLIALLLWAGSLYRLRAVLGVKRLRRRFGSKLLALVVGILVFGLAVGFWTNIALWTANRVVSFYRLPDIAIGLLFVPLVIPFMVCMYVGRRWSLHVFLLFVELTDLAAAARLQENRSSTREANRIRPTTARDCKTDHHGS
jgi:hypothetical protein